MTAATANGTTVTASKLEAAVFPLDSFKDAAPHLRRPFTAQAVKFKMQATWPKDNPTGGLVVCYIDARLVVERLNLIVPHLWHDEYEPVTGGLLCRLTVDGISRIDIGSDYQGKGLYSDALKRAAVKFGIGVSLYAVPKMIVNVSDGQAKVKSTPKGKTLELTPNGETRVRDLYAAWLDVKGVDAFGPTLDHGDAEGAQGDFEADEPTAPAPPSMPEPEVAVPDEGADPGPFLLAKDIVDELVAAKKQTGKDDEWVRQQLVAVGLASVPAGRVTLATIRKLTDNQALRLLERFETAVETQDAAAQAGTEVGE